MLLGIGLLVALTAMKLAIPAIGRPTPFLAYFIPVLGAAWLGGLAAGVTITVLVAIAGTSWALAGTPDADWLTISLQFIVFCFDGIAVSWLAARTRSSARDALVQRQAVLDALDMGVTMMDAKGQIIYANAAAARMIGFDTVEELVATPLDDFQRHFELLDPEGQPIPPERMPHRAVLAGEEPEEVLAQLRVRGREPRFVLGSAHAVRDAGALRFVVGSFRDVTAARRDASRREFVARATEALSSSLDYETTLATVARLAVPQMADWCAVDMLENGEIRRVASAHVDPTKVRLVEEYQRRYPYDLESGTGVPAILRTGKAELRAVIPRAGIEAAAADEEHLRFLRELKLHSYIGVPLVAEGRPCGVITLVMAESPRSYDEDDLAFATALADRASVAIENARLFRAAQQAREEAVLASRAKDDFLAMLGHELRNPLAPITSALEVMKASGTTGSDARAREVIERQVRVMVRLVDDLLDVSRIAHGRVGLVMDRVDVAKMIEKGLEIAAPLITQRGHTTVVDVTPGLEVRGDQQRLVQVLANLFTNAAKYSEPGGRIMIRGAREGDEVVIRVRDTGVGISPEMLPWIFDVFVQQPQALDRAQGGLGLGLAIVKGIVELHGGRVTAHSEGMGRGTEIVVRLPANRVVTAAVAAATPAKQPGPARPGMRVLLVDDNVDALEMLAEVLRHFECETFTASDAESALAIAREARPTIALLDIGLPGMDGYELGRRLREMEGLEELVLVALTGYGQPSDHARSTAAGFVAHLVKPIAFTQLQVVLDEAQARWMNSA